MPVTLQDLEIGERVAVEEFAQFLKWAGPVDCPRPTRNLALAWYEGHLTIEEGRRIETDQQIAHFLKSH